ncbi:MAG: sugar transferase [Lachnospiraceae bacterium]|nr:sugar transferase [Lachnospiraceae bacterium]
MLLSSKKFRIALLLVIDVISIILSFSIAYFLRYNDTMSFSRGFFISDYYQRTIAVLLLIGALVFFLHEQDKDGIAGRGLFQNFTKVVKNTVTMLIYTVIYFFITQEGILVSRYVIGVFFVVLLLLDYLLRMLYRLFLIKVAGSTMNAVNIMLIARSADAPRVIRNFQSRQGLLMHISCITLLDDDRVGRSIEGVPVVGNRDNYLDTHRNNVYDEVFIYLPYDYSFELKKMVSGFEQMGVTVNIHIEVFDMDVRDKSIRSIAGYHVISFRTRSVSTGELFAKRMIDIIGSIVGMVLFLIAYIILGPIIRFTSPGPVLFAQTRVGINGRRFKLYKFRSMYADAEERKAELIKENQMKGFMFKMDNDPRITPVGRFIRKTSIDELPQFLNVFIGDMSLVGTRPPTVDEYEKYLNYHMRRLSIKPGITGMWQVSGRSDISDFEQVVKLDLQYIDNWSLLLDFRLILRTIKVVIMGRGAK